MRFLQPVGFLYNTNGNTNSNVTLDTVSYATNGNHHQQLNRNSSHQNSNLRIQQPLVENDINTSPTNTLTSTYIEDDDNPSTITITSDAVTFSKNNFNRLHHNNSATTTTGSLDDNNYQQNINNLNLQHLNNKTLNDNEKTFVEKNNLLTGGTADLTTNNKLVERVDNIRADAIQVSLYICLLTF